MPSKIYIGTAGWSIPRAEQPRFPPGESHLARYAEVLPAVEINSTFYRPHRASTFERWAASVPRAFRFSVKIPRTITHDQRLASSAALLKSFLADLAPLGSRLGCLLVQLRAESCIRRPRRPCVFHRAAKTIRSRRRTRAEACELVR